MTKLSESVQRTCELLEGADLADDSAVHTLLTEMTNRRQLDLSDLSPDQQAELIAVRSQELQPSANALTERIVAACAKGRPFVAKFGIDPTGAEVHIGHAVPMLVLSRFQRMGHQVVFIVGDMTAKIGDPSGRSDERPPLTDEEIAFNLATYREQVTPFFDFERAHFRHNGDWLRQVTLVKMIEIMERIPVSMPLQREDFRKRLESGQGLSLAELVYSIVMALDSVETNCDLEVGGLDQFLNMQMCRKVMEVCGQTPEIVIATPLIEGTDGTGTKMSKSKGNYIPLTATPSEMFGKLMSVPDRLVESYFRALTEWLDTELVKTRERLRDGTLHPMALKKILAGEVTAAVHGVDAAMQARADFTARFSSRNYGEIDTLPVASGLERSVLAVVKDLGFARSNSEVRRIASQDGLRLVVEVDGDQRMVVLGVDVVGEPLANLATDALGTSDGDLYLKVGRKLARLRLPWLHDRG